MKENSFLSIPYWDIFLSLQSYLWIALFLGQCSTESNVTFGKLLAAQWAALYPCWMCVLLLTALFCFCGLLERECSNLSFSQ